MDKALEQQLIQRISSGERTMASMLLDMLKLVPGGDWEGFGEMKQCISRVAIHLWGLETGADFEFVPLHVDGRTIDDNFAGLAGQFIIASAQVYRIVYNNPNAFWTFTKLSKMFWDAVDHCQEVIDRSRSCRTRYQTYHSEMPLSPQFGV